jgi:hypothetical protein
MEWLDLTGIFGQADPNSGALVPGEGYHLQLLSRSGITVVPEAGCCSVLGALGLRMLRRARRDQNGSK